MFAYLMPFVLRGLLVLDLLFRLGFYRCFIYFILSW